MEEKWIKVNQYNQVKVDEYNGKYSIIQGNQGQNDVVYPKWCTPQKWNQGEKTPLKKNGEFVYVPWSISLGNDKEQAKKILGALYHSL